MTNKLLRQIILLLIYLFIILLLQTTLIRYIKISNCFPNLLFIYLIFLSLFTSEMISMPFAFVIGILIDSLSYNIIGLSPFLFTIIAYVCAKLRIKLVTENILIQMVTTFTSFVIYAVIIGLFYKPEIGEIQWQNLLIIAFRAVYTAVVSPIVIIVLIKSQKLILPEAKSYV